MDYITLVWTPTGWMLRTTDPKVKELFGTDTIPTPFTAKAPTSMVLKEISRQNPDMVIRVKMER
jgi:hypothetical protein